MEHQMVRLVVLLLLTALVACLAFSIPEVAHHRSLSRVVGKHNRLFASALSTGLKYVVDVDAYPDGERLLQLPRVESRVPTDGKYGKYDLKIDSLVI